MSVYNVAKLVLLLLCFVCIDCVLLRETEAHTSVSRVKKRSSSVVFNVESFGARADGVTDNRNAFKATWNEACKAKGNVNILIPKGTYLLGPVRFSGPCINATSMTVRVKGYLKATTNLSSYRFGTGWIEFLWLEGLTLTGGGTFDGQGAKAWPFNSCPTDVNCKLLPTNVKFVGMNRTVIHRITSVNSNSSATNVTFENITMNNVTNPIIIDQEYCPFISCPAKGPSLVKLSDIHFRNIRGTSSSIVAVMLQCSRGIPCRNIYIENVHLDLSSGEEIPTSSCKNVRATYIGTQIPPPCT
ncbi:hypothetical protein ACFE04_013077 [Oxalis oulophora]